MRKILEYKGVKYAHIIPTGNPFYQHFAIIGLPPVFYHDATCHINMYSAEPIVRQQISKLIKQGFDFSTIQN